MNHNVCGHYNANYGCSKYLDEVYIMGQLLPKHMKACKGLTKEAADTVTAENKGGTFASSSKDGTTTSSGKKKKHRSKDLPSDSQPPPQSSQVSLQVSPHCNECTNKKSATTPKMSGSSG